MEDQEYKTLDIGEAAALYCLGYDLRRLERTTKNNQRAFIFADDFPATPIWAADDLPTASLSGRDYRSRAKGLMVDAYSFFLAYKEMKSQIHDDIEMDEK